MYSRLAMIAYKYKVCHCFKAKHLQTLLTNRSEERLTKHMQLALFSTGISRKDFVSLRNI
jgi:hypothetical protein